MKDKIRMEYRLVMDGATPPKRFRDTDAAYDIYAAEDKIVHGHTYQFIQTGIQCAAPVGYYWTIESRSGLIKNGVFAMRGIIDGTYNGNVIICLHNAGNDHYTVRQGDRIAQMILHEVVEPEFDEVEEFSEEYDQRGAKGWGSSGT